MSEAIPYLFFHLLSTAFSIQLIVNKIADYWIRTTDLWCWKRHINQLGNEHCPNILLVYCLLVSVDTNWKYLSKLFLQHRTWTCTWTTSVWSKSNLEMANLFLLKCFFFFAHSATFHKQPVLNSTENMFAYIWMKLKDELYSTQAFLVLLFPALAIL